MRQCVLFQSCSSDDLLLSTHSLSIKACQELINYRPQTKLAKVMFLQVSVCPHWGGACVVLFGGVCVVLFGGPCVFLFRGGMHGFIWGGCVVLFGGMHGFIRGACVVLFRGACVVLLGGHAWFYSGGHAWFFWGGMRGFFQFFRIQWDTINERAVRILLECILVPKNFPAFFMK